MAITCTKPTAKPTPTPMGFTMPCPYCGQTTASITLQLHALDSEAFHCLDCDAVFSLEDVRSLVARWQRLLSWVDAVPQFDE